MTVLDHPVAERSRPTLVLHEVATLGEHAAAWDAMVETATTPSPFLLSWWLQPHETEPGATYVLVLDGDELIGGLATVIDRRFGVRRVRMLGAGSLAPDHLDLVAAPDRRRQVIAALASWFREAPGLIDLQGVAEDALVLSVLPSSPLVTVVSTSPYVTLTDEPVKPLHRKRDLRSQARRVEREGASYRVVDGSDPAEVTRALSDLRARHIEVWGDRSGLIRGYQRFEQAAHAAAAGSVRFHELEAEGDVVATEVTFDIAGRRLRYQVGRSMDHRWRGAGNALLQHVIHATQAEGLQEFDLLRGGTSYKYDWTDTERLLLRARAAHGAVPRAVLRGLRVAERGRPAGRVVKARVRQHLGRRHG